MTELAVGERCGITIPTRVAFDGVGLRRDARAHRREAATTSRRSSRSRSRYTHEGRLRDYVFTPEPIAQGRLLRQLPEVQGAPVDDGDVLDEELHRHPGRSPSPHRSRSRAQREDRRPAVHHPAAVHRHRRHHRRRGAHAHADAVRPRSLIIMGNNQVAFDAVCCAIIGVDPRDGRSHPARRGARLRHDRSLARSRSPATSRSTRRKAAREGLQGRPHPRREVLRGHEHHRLRRPAARGRAHRLLLGRLPGRDRGGDRDPARRSTRSCDEKMPRMHVVFGAYEGPIDAKPGEKVVFIGDCAKWEGQARRQARADRERLQGSRAPRIRTTRSTTTSTRRWSASRASCAEPKRATYVRLEGCPVSVAEQVLALVSLGGSKNPFFVPAESAGSTRPT